MTPADIVATLGAWRHRHEVDHDGESWWATHGRWEVYAVRLDTGIPRWEWSVGQYRHDGESIGRVDRGESIDAEAAARDLARAVDRIIDRVRG